MAKLGELGVHQAEQLVVESDYRVFLSKLSLFVWWDGSGICWLNGLLLVCLHICIIFVITLSRLGLILFDSLEIVIDSRLEELLGMLACIILVYATLCGKHLVIIFSSVVNAL